MAQLSLKQQTIFHADAAQCHRRKFFISLHDSLLMALNVMATIYIRLLGIIGWINGDIKDHGE